MRDSLPPSDAAPPVAASRSVRHVSAVAVLAVVAAVLLIALVLVTREEDPPRPAAQTVNTVSGEVRGRQEMRLELHGGAESVTVHSEDLGDTLFRASTLPGSNLAPTVTDDGSSVTLGLRGTALAGQASLHVYLHAGVRWSLRLAGGGLHQVLDFGTGRLAGVELVGSVGEIRLSVPAPVGTMPIRVAGAGRLTVQGPNGQPSPPARISVAAGGSVGAVTLDGVAHPGPAAGAALAGPGWDAAVDRYDIAVGGGVAALTVERR